MQYPYPFLCFPTSAQKAAQGGDCKNITIHDKIMSMSFLTYSTPAHDCGLILCAKWGAGGGGGVESE
jgi:hypothetical protein